MNILPTLSGILNNIRSYKIIITMYCRVCNIDVICIIIIAQKGGMGNSYRSRVSVSLELIRVNVK